MLRPTIPILKNCPSIPMSSQRQFLLANARDQEAASKEDNINQGHLVSPGDIVPRIKGLVPSASHRGTAALVTGSPYKSTLTESERKRELSAKHKLI
jgi:hypothetical protein